MEMEIQCEKNPESVPTHTGVQNKVILKLY